MKLPLILGYIHTPTHNSIANQGLFTSKGHKHTKTLALSPNHNQPNHLLINLGNKQNLLARISLACFQLNRQLLVNKQKKNILVDYCYFSMNLTFNIPFNLLPTFPTIVNVRHTWQFISFKCCYLLNVFIYIFVNKTCPIGGIIDIKMKAFGSTTTWSSSSCVYMLLITNFFDKT